MSQVEPIALVGGTLIDGSGGEPTPDAVVLIEGTNVSRVGRRGRVPLPEACRVFDVAGKTVMPGMMDLHVHLALCETDVVTPSASLPPGLGEPLALRGIKAFGNARRALEMGFTTLRDAGDFGGNIAVSVRNAIRAGVIEGPRLLVCGEALTTTGGHLDLSPAWLTRPEGGQFLADGVDGVRRAVRRQTRMKVDWIKFFASGSALDPEDQQEFSDEELAVLMAEAHGKDKPVCAHCGKAKGTLAAIKAGMDTVEHGMDLTDEIVELMVERGTILVPTVAVMATVGSRGPAFGLPPEYISRLGALAAGHRASFQRALRAGVKMACGTDAGFNHFRHGESGAELETLVDWGMTPMQALVTATSSSAAALRLGDRLGKIAPGMLADVVVVDGDPLADIKVLQDRSRIALVMKEGAICANRLLGLS